MGNLGTVRQDMGRLIALAAAIENLPLLAPRPPSRHMIAGHRRTLAAKEAIDSKQAEIMCEILVINSRSTAGLQTCTGILRGPPVGLSMGR